MAKRGSDFIDGLMFNATTAVFFFLMEADEKKKAQVLLWCVETF